MIEFLLGVILFAIQMSFVITIGLGISYVIFGARKWMF